MQTSFNNILFSSILDNAYEANLIFLGIENINSLRQENYQSNNIPQSSVIDILARKVFLLFKVLFFSDFSEKLNRSFVVLSELKTRRPPPNTRTTETTNTSNPKLNTSRSAPLNTPPQTGTEKEVQKLEEQPWMIRWREIEREKAELEEKKLLMAKVQKDNAHILENVDRQIAEFNKKVDALSQLALGERIEGLKEILAQSKNFQEEQVKAHKESIDKYKQIERNRENKIPGFTVKTLDEFKSYILAQRMSNIGETALNRVRILVEGMQKKMSTMTTLKRAQQVAENAGIAAKNAEIAANNAVQFMQEAELAAEKTEVAYKKARAAIVRCEEIREEWKYYTCSKYEIKANAHARNANAHADKIGQIVEITKIAARINLSQSPLNYGYKIKLLYASQLSSEQRAAHCSSINEIQTESLVGIHCTSGSLGVYPTLLAVDENNKVCGYLFLGCKNELKQGIQVEHLCVHRDYRSHQEHLGSRLLVLAFLTAELMEASTAWLEFRSTDQHARSRAHFYQTKMKDLGIHFTSLLKEDISAYKEHDIEVSYSIKGISARLPDIVRGIANYKRAAA